MNAEKAIDNLNLGESITYLGENIAEIVSKNEAYFDIKDIQGKYWHLHREKLEKTNYAQFLQDLALIIDPNWFEHINHHPAREVLSAMPVNTNLFYGDQWIAMLINIEETDDRNQILTFEDHRGNELSIPLDKFSDEFTYDDFIHYLMVEIEHGSQQETHSILIDFFKEEFVPMMVEQMKIDHRRLGDSWMMKTNQAYEKQVQKHYEEYFEMYEIDGKPIPWLKISGYAVIAQARHDHPEWLL